MVRGDVWVSGSTSLMEIVGTGLVAALVSAIVSKVTSDKDSRLRYVTKERERWRHDLRKFVADVNEAFHSSVPQQRRLRVLRAEMQVRLNPDDPLDNRILATLDQLIEDGDNKLLSAFNEQMARLLKHDWERAKLEASGSSSPRKLVWYTLAGAGVLLIILEAHFNWHVKSYDWTLFVSRIACLVAAWLLVVSGIRELPRLWRMTFSKGESGGTEEWNGQSQSVNQRRTAGEFLHILSLWWTQQVPDSIRTRYRADRTD